jgi:hypothetical protein
MGLPIGIVTAVYQVFVEASPHALGVRKTLFVIFLNVVGWPCFAYLFALAIWHLGIARRFLPYLEAEDD